MGVVVNMAECLDVVVKTVSPDAVFNLPLYEHYLVIDARSIGEYEDGHVATSVSFPFPPETCSEDECSEDEKERRLVRFAMDYATEYCRPENPNPVVIYGGRENVESLSHAKWLGKKLQDLQQQRKIVAIPEAQPASMEGPDSYNPLETFYQTVADRVKEIWILEGGYEAFLNDYPFLCGDVKFEDMHPTPHLITRQLFLGSRVIPLTANVLKQINITHVILSEYQDVDWFELNNFQTLRCEVRDSNQENMLPCWEACCDFVDSAVTVNGRVLVIVHGRSRSASIVLAYLIKKLGLGFEASWEFLCKSCWHLIDRSLVYETQLREWEHTQVHALLDR